MQRKGFPESYDVRRLLRVPGRGQVGQADVTAPVYSHLTLRHRPGRRAGRAPARHRDPGGAERAADRRRRSRARAAFVSDFFDFSIYIDADAKDIQDWYVARFLTLRETVFTDPKSYFHRYAALSDAEAREIALRLWREINSVNLAREHPTDPRARPPDHSQGRGSRSHLRATKKVVRTRGMNCRADLQVRLGGAKAPPYT